MIKLLNFINSSFYLNPITPTKHSVQFPFLKKKLLLAERLKEVSVQHGGYGLSNSFKNKKYKKIFNQFKQNENLLIVKNKLIQPSPSVKQKLFLTYLSLNYGVRQTSFGVEQMLQSSLNENFPFYKNFDIKKQFFYFYEIPIPDDLENQSFAVQRFFNTLPFNKLKYTPFIVSEQNHKFFKTYYKDNFVKNFNKKLFSSYNTLIYFFNFISGLFFFKKKIMFLEYQDLLVNQQELYYFDEVERIMAPIDITYDFDYHTKPDDDDMISHALEGEVYLKNLYSLPKKFKLNKKINFFTKLKFFKQNFFKCNYYRSYFIRKFKILKDKKSFKFAAKIKNFNNRIKKLLVYSKLSSYRLNLKKIHNDSQNFDLKIHNKVEKNYQKLISLEKIIVTLLISKKKRTKDFILNLHNLVEKYYFYSFFFAKTGLDELTRKPFNFTDEQLINPKFIIDLISISKAKKKYIVGKDLKKDFYDNNFLRESFVLTFTLKEKIKFLTKQKKLPEVLDYCKKLLLKNNEKINRFLATLLHKKKTATKMKAYKKFIKFKQLQTPTTKLNINSKLFYLMLFHRVKIKNKFIKYILIKKLVPLVFPVPELKFNKNKKINLSKLINFTEKQKNKFYDVRFYKDINYLSKFNQFNLANYNNLLFRTYFGTIFKKKLSTVPEKTFTKYYFRNRVRFFNFVRKFKIYLSEKLTNSFGNEINQKNNLFYLIKKVLVKFMSNSRRRFDFFATPAIDEEVQVPLLNRLKVSNYKKSKLYATDYFNTPLLPDNVNVVTKDWLEDEDKSLIYSLSNILDKLEFFNETYLKLIFIQGSKLPFNKKTVISFVHNKLKLLRKYARYFNLTSLYKNEKFKSIMLQFRYLFKLYKSLYNFMILKPYIHIFVRKMIIYSRKLKKKSYFNKFKYYLFIKTYCKLIKILIRSKLFIKHTFLNYSQSYYFNRINGFIDNSILFRVGTFELDESKLTDRQYVLDNAEDIMLTLNDVYDLAKKKYILETVTPINY